MLLGSINLIIIFEIVLLLFFPHIYIIVKLIADPLIFKSLKRYYNQLIKKY